MGRAAGHVAVITSNYWPEPTGISQTVTELAEFLAVRGLDVRVATAMPYYPEWRIYPGYGGRLHRTESHNGVTIRRAWHYVTQGPGTVARLLQEASLCAASLPNMIRVLWRARMAYVVSPCLTHAYVGTIVARRLGVPVTLVVKDVMPEAAVEMGLLRNRALIAVSGWLARRMYEAATEIQTLGQGMARRIAVAGAQAAKIRVVPDTIDGRELVPIPLERNEFRRRYVSPGSFAVVHTGNMGRKQDLEVLLRTADRLRGYPDIRFYVFGDGAVKEEFLRRRDALGLDNVEQHPLQERPFLAHMLSGADVVLVSQLAEVVDVVVPSKLVTAMGAGAMVIGACAEGSETARMIRSSGGGLVVPPGDDEALARAIMDVRNGRVDTIGCRAAARRFALTRFDREAVYGPLADEASARVAAA